MHNFLQCLEESQLSIWQNGKKEAGRGRNCLYHVGAEREQKKAMKSSSMLRVAPDALLASLSILGRQTTTTHPCRRSLNQEIGLSNHGRPHSDGVGIDMTTANCRAFKRNYAAIDLASDRLEIVHMMVFWPDTTFVVRTVETRVCALGRDGVLPGRIRLFNTKTAKLTSGKCPRTFTVLIRFASL